MYIIVITCHPGGLHRCDPFVNGPIFNDECEAERFLKKYQNGWTERDWDTYEGHVLEINA
jgi:hypothetical protein